MISKFLYSFTEITNKKKKAKKKEKKKENTIARLLSQFLLKLLKMIKIGQKNKIDSIGNGIDLDDAVVKKKKVKKNKIKEESKKEEIKNNKEVKERNKEDLLSKSSSKASEETISYISVLLKKYEDFVQKDFLIIIEDLSAYLRNMKSNIISNESNHHLHSIEEIQKHTAELGEIINIYTQSEIMVGNFIGDCKKYSNIMKDSKRVISPTQSLNRVQCQLDRVMKKLQQGQKMVDISSNKDYLYVNNYLQKAQSSVTR